jgi:iron complex outermembrane receptor protein
MTASRRLPKLAATLTALAAQACCLHAIAQAPAAPQQLERVEVTGSNIKRLAAETASPVQVYTRSDVKQTGANTVRQVLDTITATTTTELRDDGNSSSFAAGASGASLRGLGKSATLVLLNGRRVAYFPLADGAKETFVNTDAIPADAIERIEILKDGASAIYGSDAMAGVINIITRRDYQGVGMSASYQTSTSPAVRKEKTVGLVAGWGDMAKDRFNVLANLELYERDGYFLSDVISAYPAWHKSIYSPAFGDPSLASYPGNLIRGTVSPTTGLFSQASSNFRVPVSTCPDAQKNSAGACTTNINALNQYSDPAKRLNLFSAARVALGNEMEAFAEISYSKTKTEYLDLPFGMNAPGTAYRWFDGYARKVQIVQKPLLAANNPANTTGAPAGLEYRFMDNTGMWAVPSEADQYRALVGVRGVFRNWDWEATLGRIGADGVKEGIGAHRTEFVNAVSSGEYKIGGTNSQGLLDRMFQRNELRGRNSQNVADFKASGEVFQLPAGPALLAVGAEVRDESLRIKSSQNLLNAEIIGRGSVWVEGERKLYAAFAELEAPVVKGLTANGAVRLDKATGFDSHVSPKLSLRYEALPGKLLLRSTVGTGFRAPNIPETLGIVGLTGFFNGTVDPKRCATATQIRDILRTGDANDRNDATAAYNSGCSVSIPAMISANPAVKPELSRSVTVGFVFDPIKELSIAMDYFRIERRDEISYRDPDYVLAREDQTGYQDLVARAPISSTDLQRAARANALKPGANINWTAGDLITLLLQYENFGKSLVSGLDLDVKGRFNLGNQMVYNTSLTSTYMLTQKEWDIDANAYRPNRVGLRNAPRLRMVWANSLTIGSWTPSLRLNYTSKMALNNDETDVASWSEAACRARLNPGDLQCYRTDDLRVDLGLRYTGFKNLALTANINNALGTDLPVNLRDGYTWRPRTVKVSAEYKF